MGHAAAVGTVPSKSFRVLGSLEEPVKLMVRDYHVSTCQAYNIRAQGALFPIVFHLFATTKIVIFAITNNAKLYTADGGWKLPW